MKEIKKALVEAKAAYHALNDKHSDAERALRVAHDRVVTHQKSLSDKISEGANPCPGCGQPPIGMEQADDTFEVGCMTCRPFLHDDGTMRSYRARGGMMPKHVVEAWNAGPDYWVKTKAGR